MKKLSEIGRTLKVGHAVMTHDSEVLEESLAVEILLTPAERRELVLLALTKWEESKVMAVSYGPTIEKFLEENGI